MSILQLKNVHINGEADEASLWISRSKKTDPLCEFCRQTAASYKCPRCSQAYCGLSCYKSPQHSGCSEQFYEANVKQELESIRSKERPDSKSQDIWNILEKFTGEREGPGGVKDSGSEWKYIVPDGIKRVREEGRGALQGDSVPSTIATGGTGVSEDLKVPGAINQGAMGIKDITDTLPTDKDLEKILDTMSEEQLLQLLSPEQRKDFMRLASEHSDRNSESN